MREGKRERERETDKRDRLRDRDREEEKVTKGEIETGGRDRKR